MKKEERWHQFLASAVEQSSEGMAIADIEGKLRYVNPAWAEMHDYDSGEELIGRSLEIFHNQEQMDKDVKPFNMIVMEKGTNTGEVGHIRKDGTPFPTLMTTTLLKDENKKPVAILGVARDISASEVAEVALRYNRLKYMAIVHNIPGMVYKGFPDWSSEIISGGKTLCGYSSKELNSLEGGWLALIHPDDKERVFADGKELPDVAKDLVQVYRIISKDGNIKWVEDRKTSIFSDNGEFDGIYGVVFDITERKMMELELINERNKLQIALEEIKTLRGIIPICAYCKKIMNDQGVWDKIETYISEYTDAKFTHGACPDCFKKQIEEIHKNSD